MKKTLCPFSKPIIGGWCQCQYANLDERCAGKMSCLQADQYIAGCYDLVDIFKEQSRFILGLGANENELTHAINENTLWWFIRNATSFV